MNVTEAGFRDLAARCRRLAPRLAAVLEGGYNLETLPRLVAAAPRASRRLAPREGELLERLAARGDAELAQEALHVRAHGVLGDEEPLRDVVGREVVVEQQQHLDLPRGQRAGDVVGNAAAAPSAARTWSSRRRATSPDRAASPFATPCRNATIRSGGSLFSRYPAAPARIAARRFSSVPEAVRTTTSHDGQAEREARERRETVDPRHREVEQDEIGLQALGALERLDPVRGLADHVEAAAHEQGGKRITGQRVIVGDEDANCHVTLIGRSGRAD